MQRVRELADRLAAHGIVLGLEYLSPESRRRGHRYSFVHNLDGLRELCRAAARPNVGLVLDSFHWYCAAETNADILSLAPAEIVTVHLSDAVAGLDRRQQQAFARELPGATDVIDNAGFVAALKAIGYRGPIGCEPMNRAFAALAPERAVTAAAAALRRVASAVGLTAPPRCARVASPHSAASSSGARGSPLSVPGCSSLRTAAMTCCATFTAALAWVLV